MGKNKVVAVLAFFDELSAKLSETRDKYHTEQINNYQKTLYQSVWLEARLWATAQRLSTRVNCTYEPL
jgi:hypothetical protein